MGTYSKIILSGSTDGKAIVVGATAPSVGTLIHTAVTGSGNSIDEVYIYAHNLTTGTKEVNILAGPTSAGRYTFTMTQAQLKGLVLIMPGLPFNATVAIKAWATVANQIQIFGYVNRFSS